MAQTILSESLPVQLNAKELKTRSEQLAKKVDEHDDLEETRKAEAKRHKGLVDMANAEIRRLANIVNSGKEHRQVEVIWEANPTNRTMELYRTDTGDMVRSRPMTNDEVNRHSTGNLFGDNVELEVVKTTRPERPEDAN